MYMHGTQKIILKIIKKKEKKEKTSIQYNYLTLTSQLKVNWPLGGLMC